MNCLVSHIYLPMGSFVMFAVFLRVGLCVWITPIGFNISLFRNVWVCSFGQVMNLPVNNDSYQKIPLLN